MDWIVTVCFMSYMDWIAHLKNVQALIVHNSDILIEKSHFLSFFKAYCRYWYEDACNCVGIDQKEYRTHPLNSSNVLQYLF